MSKETFGSNTGDGIGCFLLLLGLAIFIVVVSHGDKVIEIIGRMVK